MDEAFHFSYIILHLSLVIAGGDPDSKPNVYWKISGQ
jgi:hypothetical protein